MKPRYPLMIPGARAGSATLEVRAPYDGRILATVETADAAATDLALQTAFNLYRDRSTWLTIPERVRILQETAAMMSEEAEALAMLIASEGGKPLTDARVEVARAIDGVQLCIETIRTQRGEMIPMNLNTASSDRIAFTQHEPIGVVLAFSAFNHPLNLIVHQVAPAIAAGCPCIIKPAEATPLSCIRFVQFLRRAGLPDPWCQVAIVDDLKIAAGMVSDPRVGFFGFIGSSRIGWMLRSQLAPGTRCALEHGGAAAVIIAADADMEQAIPLLVKGGLYHAGQVCVSVQRVFAHASIARTLAENMAAAAKKLVVGDPEQPETEVGPLIRHAEVKRVHTWVEEAVEEGAELLCGGVPLSDSCYAGTILFDPSAASRVSCQEIFGPVICIYPYSNLNEAIERANGLDFSFQASVFSSSLDTALAVGSRLDAAAVMVNDHTAFRVDWMPFAGLKHSGLGRGGIAYTMQDMQIEKLIVIRS